MGSGKIPGGKSTKEKPFYRTCQELMMKVGQEGRLELRMCARGQECGTHLSQALQETSP